MDIHKAMMPKSKKRVKTTQNVQKLAENQGQGWPGWKDQWPEYDLVEKQVWRRHCVTQRHGQTLRHVTQCERQTLRHVTQCDGQTLDIWQCERQTPKHVTQCERQALRHVTQCDGQTLRHVKQWTHNVSNGGDFNESVNECDILSCDGFWTEARIPRSVAASLQPS